MFACGCGSTWFVYAIQIEEDGQELPRDRAGLACIRCGTVYQRVRRCTRGWEPVQDGLQTTLRVVVGDHEPRREPDSEIY